MKIQTIDYEEDFAETSIATLGKYYKMQTQ
jgi:hypothetical protein